MSGSENEKAMDRIFELETKLRHLTNELRLIQAEYDDANKKYFDIHFRLEEKIKERTCELNRVNKKLVEEIDERKRQEQAKEQLILELREALNKVKLLSGFLPICASCKKIRDDQGYWSQIEEYISKHSEAEFSHGICPECSKKLYPDLHNKLEARKRAEDL